MESMPASAAQRKHAARRADFYDVSPVLDDLAHFVLHVFDAVGNADLSRVELVRKQVVIAVSAGNTERWTAGIDAGAGNIAGINGIAQGHVSESIRSHVSYRRKAGQQSDALVFGANEGLARNRDGESVVAEPGIECEVGMRVDQAGENGFARQVDDRGAGVCGCAQV